MLAVRRRDQQVLDRVHVVAEWLLHANHQVELALALNHLSGRRAAQRGFDQRVHVAHVQPVAGDLGAIRRDHQAGLAQFPHQNDVSDAAHLAK